MSPSVDLVQADVSLVGLAPTQTVPADLGRAASVRAAGVRVAAGSVAAGVLLLAVPSTALALPAGAEAPVLDLRGPVVALYAGTAEADGSTTLEPTTTGSKSRLDCTILFGKDSDVLRPGAAELLGRLADQLHAQGAGHVAVTGYTDDLGSAAHGLDLSGRRASRVARELRLVLPARQFPLEVRGLGEAHPAVPNISESNRRKNRRVVVTVTRTPATPAPKSTGAAPTPAVPAAPSPTASPTPTRTASAAPSAASTLAAQQPPPVPSASAPQPHPDSRTPPWPWIGGAAAALIGLGALVDRLRRRTRTSDGLPSAAGPVSEPSTAGGAAPTSRPGPGTAHTTTSSLRPSGDRAASLPLRALPPLLAAEPALLLAEPGAMDRPDSVLGREGSTSEARLEAALAADLAAWGSSDTHRPRLSVLGPIRVRARGQALARRRPFYTELFAYLALRPGGATVDEIADAFTLTPARVRTDMKILRDWLGADPATGAAFLPDARTTPAALRRGLAVYQLDGTLCDWNLFTRLQAAAKSKDGAARAADLQVALNLVTGHPFDHARPAGWGWLFEGDRVDLHATAAVVDVAVELFGYHRAHHDDAAARHVGETLTTIDPVKAHETMTGTTP